MKLLKLLLVLGLLGMGYQWWSAHKRFNSVSAQPSPNGFIHAAMFDGAKRNTAVIYAPINCPSEVGQRADALEAELTRMGVPNVRSDSYSLNVPDPTPEENANIQRAVTLLNGQIPVVFVNGMGKSNPTAEEVRSEYERTKLSISR